MTEDGWSKNEKYVLATLNSIQETQKENHKDVSTKLDECHTAITTKQLSCDKRYVSKPHAKTLMVIVFSLISALASGLITMYTIVNKHESSIATNKAKIEEVSNAMESMLKTMEIKKGWVTYKTRDKTVRLHYEKEAEKQSDTYYVALPKKDDKMN